jgi:hypothetical protein
MPDLRRRQFITLLGGASVWPFAVRAQQGQRLRRLAWLGAGRADEPSPYLESLRAGLGELGWTEGRNLIIGRFWATGLDNMEAVGRELLASDPEVIVTQEFTVLGLRSLKRPSCSASAAIRSTSNSCRAGPGPAAISPA